MTINNIANKDPFRDFQNYLVSEIEKVAPHKDLSHLIGENGDYSSLVSLLTLPEAQTLYNVPTFHFRLFPFASRYFISDSQSGTSTFIHLLKIASREGRIACLNWLLLSHPFGDKALADALDLAAVHGKFRAVELLLLAGVAWRIDTLFALIIRHENAMLALLLSGRPLTSTSKWQDKSNNTPFHIAARYSNWGAFRQIANQLHFDYQTNLKKKTFVHYVISNASAQFFQVFTMFFGFKNPEKIIPLLIGGNSYNKLLSFFDFYPDTFKLYHHPDSAFLLHMAVEGGDLKTVEFVYGALPHTLHGTPPLKECRYTTSPLLLANRLDIIQFLLSKGADLHEKDENNEGLLEKICMEDRRFLRGEGLQIVKYLIQQGAAYGSSTLNYAIVGNNLDIIRYLHEELSVPFTNADGRTPLHFASDFDHLEIYCYLVDRGHKKDAVNSFEGGATPLRIAVVNALKPSLGSSNRILNYEKETQSGRTQSFLNKLALQNGCTENLLRDYLDIMHNLYTLLSNYSKKEQLYQPYTNEKISRLFPEYPDYHPIREEGKLLVHHLRQGDAIQIFLEVFVQNLGQEALSSTSELSLHKMHCNQILRGLQTCHFLVLNHYTDILSEEDFLFLNRTIAYYQHLLEKIVRLSESTDFKSHFNSLDIFAALYEISNTLKTSSDYQQILKQWPLPHYLESGQDLLAIGISTELRFEVGDETSDQKLERLAEDKCGRLNELTQIPALKEPLHTFKESIKNLKTRSHSVMAEESLNLSLLIHFLKQKHPFNQALHEVTGYSLREFYMGKEESLKWNELTSS